MQCGIFNARVPSDLIFRVSLGRGWQSNNNAEVEPGFVLAARIMQVLRACIDEDTQRKVSSSEGGLWTAIDLYAIDELSPYFLRRKKWLLFDSMTKPNMQPI